MENKTCGKSNTQFAIMSLIGASTIDNIEDLSCSSADKTMHEIELNSDVEVLGHSSNVGSPVKLVTKTAAFDVEDEEEDDLEDFFTLDTYDPQAAPKVVFKQVQKEVKGEEPDVTVYEDALDDGTSESEAFNVTGTPSKNPHYVEIRNSITPPPVRARRSITPPPVIKRLRTHHEIDALRESEDAHDQALLKQMQRENERMKDSWEKQQNHSDGKRIYIAEITSRLPGSKGVMKRVRLFGTQQFFQVMNAVLTQIGNETGSFFEQQDIILYYKSTKLLHFMTPNLLNLPEQSGETIVPLDLVHINEAYEHENELERIAKEIENDEDDDIVVLEPPATTQSVDDEIEKELRELAKQGTLGSRDHTQEEHEDRESFKIKLTGRDGTKIVVKVKSDTVLNKVAEYYLRMRELPLGTQIKLVFDDEEMDLNQNVGDTELEDDDCIDVVL